MSERYHHTEIFGDTSLFKSCKFLLITSIGATRALSVHYFAATNIADEVKNYKGRLAEYKQTT